MYRVVAYWQSWTSTSGESANVSVDAAAPSTSTASPQYDNAGSVTVAYTAADTGGSHLKSIQLYVKKPGDSSYSATGSAVSISGDSTTGNFPAYTTSGNGTYSFYALATDNAGNTTTVPASAQTTTIEDAAAPTTTASSPAYDNAGSVTVAYTAADTGGSHLKSIQLYVKKPGDSSYSATGSAVSISGDSTTGNFPAYTTSGNGTYSFYALATDNAGNTTTVPGSAETTTTEDNVAPSSTISFPAGGPRYNLSGWNAGCSVSPFNTTNSACGTAADATSGVKQVQVSIQQGTGNYWNPNTSSFSSASEQKVTASGTTNWTLPFSASNFPADGSYTLRVYATDNAGNVQSTTTSTTFTIDTTAPIVTLTTVNGKSVTFPYSSSSSITTIGGACGTLTGDSSTVNWSVSGGATQTGSATCTSGSWTATLSPSLGTGTYSLSAMQADSAGNTGTSGSLGLSVSGIPSLFAQATQSTSGSGTLATNNVTTVNGGQYLIFVYCAGGSSNCSSDKASVTTGAASSTVPSAPFSSQNNTLLDEPVNGTKDCVDVIEATGNGNTGPITVSGGQSGGTPELLQVVQLPGNETIQGTPAGATSTSTTLAAATASFASPGPYAELVAVAINDGAGNGGTTVNSINTSPNANSMTLLSPSTYLASKTIGAELGVYYAPAAQTSATFNLSASTPWGTVAVQVG